MVFQDLKVIVVSTAIKVSAVMMEPMVLTVKKVTRVTRECQTLWTALPATRVTGESTERRALEGPQALQAHGAGLVLPEKPEMSDDPGHEVHLALMVFLVPMALTGQQGPKAGVVPKEEMLLIPRMTACVVLRVTGETKDPKENLVWTVTKVLSVSVSRTRKSNSGSKTCRHGLKTGPTSRVEVEFDRQRTSEMLPTRRSLISYNCKTHSKHTLIQLDPPERLWLIKQSLPSFR